MVKPAYSPTTLLWEGIINKVLMYEFFVNLTCLFGTQRLVPQRFSLDRFNCITIPYLKFLNNIFPSMAVILMTCSIPANLMLLITGPRKKSEKNTEILFGCSRLLSLYILVCCCSHRKYNIRNIIKVRIKDSLDGYLKISLSASLKVPHIDII
jgi:hypothetical protein